MILTYCLWVGEGGHIIYIDIFAMGRYRPRSFRGVDLRSGDLIRGKAALRDFFSATERFALMIRGEISIYVVPRPIDLAFFNLA